MEIYDRLTPELITGVILGFIVTQIIFAAVRRKFKKPTGTLLSDMKPTPAEDAVDKIYVDKQVTKEENKQETNLPPYLH